MVPLFLSEPFSISLLSSTVYCDQRVAPKDWKDVLSYWETAYLLKVRLKNNLSDEVIRVDSVCITDGYHTLGTIKYVGDFDMQPYEIRPRQFRDIEISTTGRLSQDSVYMAALIRSSLRFTGYSDFGSHSLGVDSISFFDNNKVLLHVVRSR